MVRTPALVVGDVCEIVFHDTRMDNEMHDDVQDDAKLTDAVLGCELVMTSHSRLHAEIQSDGQYCTHHLQLGKSEPREKASQSP
jgi:hypothetical protein